jgi:hypothetical protein
MEMFPNHLLGWFFTYIGISMDQNLDEILWITFLLRDATSSFIVDFFIFVGAVNPLLTDLSLLIVYGWIKARKTGWAVGCRFCSDLGWACQPLWGPPIHQHQLTVNLSFY